MSDGRPKVLHVVAKLHLGGSEQVALSLMESLRHDFDFSVFSVLGLANDEVGQDMYARLKRAGIPVYMGTSLDMKRGGMLHGAWRLRQVLRRTRPQVVHLHTDVPDATYALSRKFTFFPTERIVRTVHNTTLWPRWRRIGAWAERQIEEARMVGVSRASLESLQQFRVEHGLPRLPDERCEVVLNGVAVPPPPAENNLPDRPVRVLFAGRFEYQKGADILPAIVDRASELSARDAEVSVLGSGSLEGMLREWASRPRTRWKVSVEPPVNGLASRLSSYDVMLMPSRFEGLALTCIECVLAGTPLIVADVDGLREVFDGHAPLQAAPEDVEGFARLLAQVVDDPARHREVARGLVATTEARFGLSRMVREYRRIYGSVLAGRTEGSVVRERARGA